MQQETHDDSKRLFFAAKVHAAWPSEFPQGRVLGEEMRHITLAFLGEQSFSTLRARLPEIPRPAFRIGPAGIGTGLLFLPKQQARVVALDITWMEDPHPLFAFQKELVDWLMEAGYALRRNHPSFLPHITLARSPFDREEWIRGFEPIPFFITAVHLYERVGHLNYHSLWELPFEEPFIEREHTADLAFEIRGTSMRQLFIHAQLALFFVCPPLAQFYTCSSTETLEQMIIELNRIITLADIERGCPFKAVSFHGEVMRRSDGLLTWEMIVDV